MDKRQDTKTLARVIVSDEAEVEELTALARILREAGLIVEAKGRELLILVEDNQKGI